MKRSYQKQFHRKTKNGVGRGSAVPEEAVQLTLDRSEVLREMQEGLHRLGVSLGPPSLRRWNTQVRGGIGVTAN